MHGILYTVFRPDMSNRHRSCSFDSRICNRDTFFSYISGICTVQLQCFYNSDTYPCFRSVFLRIRDLICSTFRMYTTTVIAVFTHYAVTFTASEQVAVFAYQVVVAVKRIVTTYFHIACRTAELVVNAQCVIAYATFTGVRFTHNSITYTAFTELTVYCDIRDIRVLI